MNHLTSVGEFVGVYPQGYNKMWNSGGNENSNADDISFVDSIIVRLKNYKNLDHSKRYAIGTSNGSSFTNKLVIETSYFNAASTIVGQLPKQYSPTNQTKSINPNSSKFKIVQSCLIYKMLQNNYILQILQNFKQIC